MYRLKFFPAQGNEHFKAHTHTYRPTHYNKAVSNGVENELYIHYITYSRANGYFF